MSLKRRIKMINAISQKLVVEERTLNNMKPIKVAVFPLSWWNDLRSECGK